MRTLTEPNRYIAVHIWINKTYSKTRICEHCHQVKKTQWSNKSGLYLEDRDDWQELCKSCHQKYDSQPHMQGASFKAGAPKRYYGINIKLPQNLANEILALDLPAKSLTKRTNWLLKQQLKIRSPEAGEKALEGKR